MRINVAHKQNPYKSHFQKVINQESDKQVISCLAVPILCQVADRFLYKNNFLMFGGLVL